MNAFSYAITGRSLWEWRQQAIAQATASDIDPAEVDWLLRGLCQVDGLSLRLGTLGQQPEVAARVSLAQLAQLWQRRVADRVPIQYLTGETTWRDFTLRVSPAVLIPRPETELIIDLAVAAVTQSPQAQVLRRGVWADLGTGSGAIALGLAKAFPDADIVAVDTSEAALAIARRNALEHGLGDRIQFFHGSWFEPLAAWRGHLAGVVSNPPYIPSGIVPILEPEVTGHEPRLALDGGEDGLRWVRHLVKEGSAYLQAGGLWLVELMLGQAGAVMRLLDDTTQYTEIQAAQDLAKVERFVLATTRSPASD